MKSLGNQCDVKAGVEPAEAKTSELSGCGRWDVSEDGVGRGLCVCLCVCASADRCAAVLPVVIGSRAKTLQRNGPGFGAEFPRGFPGIRLDRGTKSRVCVLSIACQRGQRDRSRTVLFDVASSKLALGDGETVRGAKRYRVNGRPGE